MAELTRDEVLRIRAIVSPIEALPDSILPPERVVALCDALLAAWEREKGLLAELEICLSDCLRKVPDVVMVL